MKEFLLVIELARALLPKMKAEIKFKESEEEMQEIIALQIQKDLEMKLIAELQEKLQLQQLEKTVVEEQEIRKWEEEIEEQEESFQEYGIEVESAYSKDKGAYHVETPYKKNSGNETCYENKQQEAQNVSK